MTLDAPTRAYLDAASAFPSLRMLGAQKARAATAAMSKNFGPGPEVARRMQVDDPLTGLRALVLAPSATPRGIIVHFHGGGWVVGSPEEYEAAGRHLAVATGCAVALPAYRLAPEHQAPAAADDALAALVGLAQRLPADLGVDDLPIVVSGDSAGGALAISAVRRAQAEHGLAVAHQVLVYPALDPSRSSSSYRDPENQLLFDADLLGWFWDQYAPTAEQRARADVDVARGNLGSMPPTTILVAEHDVLRDEGFELAESLRRSGVEVSLTCMEGQAHGFLTMFGVLPASAEAVQLIARKLDSVLTN